MAKNISLNPLRGTRDFYPQDFAFRSWLHQKARETFEVWGFEEYDGPIIEPLSLYASKSSEEIIKKQAYTLKPPGGKKTLVLRPELTPTLARMVAARENELVFPLFWWSFGPFFRHEAPQAGRGREFYQINADILGENSPNADAQVIAVACQLLKNLGLKDNEVVILVNDRRYLEAKMELIGIKKSLWREIFRLIDKKEKIGQESYEKELRQLGLDSLAIKDLGLALKDNDFSKESPQLTEIFSTLNDLGVSSWVKFAPSIVRGFDYYTNTVFEAYLKKGSGRALLGGGRYQNLTRQIGGKREIGGVGFAAGDMVLELALRETGHFPFFGHLGATVFVTVFNEACFRESTELARLLREHHIRTELYSNPAVSLSNQLSYASKKGFPFAAILGEKEIARQKISLKDLKTGQQEELSFDEVVKRVSS
ncbi:histidine--tRNA ligase [Candidatus Shapirobacteria bacterium]|nr:histidine--tRNA ligase [Candidatus Shapirobacteria bacterium]